MGWDGSQVYATEEEEVRAKIIWKKLLSSEGTGKKEVRYIADNFKARIKKLHKKMEGGKSGIIKDKTNNGTT